MFSLLKLQKSFKIFQFHANHALLTNVINFKQRGCKTISNAIDHRIIMKNLS